MVFDASKPDLYRTYTRSGDVIEYIVWPALLLHENGPVLYKGVAQMTTNKDVDIYENTQCKNKSDWHVYEKPIYMCRRNMTYRYYKQKKTIIYINYIIFLSKDK